MAVDVFRAPGRSASAGDGKHTQKVHLLLQAAPEPASEMSMDGQIQPCITAAVFAPTSEQLREAALDLYDACKFALDPLRSGYSLFSHRATLMLEAAVAKAEGQKVVASDCKSTKH